MGSQEHIKAAVKNIRRGIEKLQGELDSLELLLDDPVDEIFVSSLPSRFQLNASLVREACRRFEGDKLAIEWLKRRGVIAKTTYLKDVSFLGQARRAMR